MLKIKSDWLHLPLQLYSVFFTLRKRKLEGNPICDIHKLFSQMKTRNEKIFVYAKPVSPKIEVFSLWLWLSLKKVTGDLKLSNLPLIPPLLKRNYHLNAIVWSFGLFSNDRPWSVKNSQRMSHINLKAECARREFCFCLPTNA